MHRSSVYIETSIVSYLAARPSNNLVTAACQQVTRDWWDVDRPNYTLFTSELVVLEAAAGQPEVAARRLALLQGIPELKITDEATALAARLLQDKAVPAKAQADALHISLAAVPRVEYLLTWNCRHIDNPATKPAIRRVCATGGVACPEICTPIEIREVGRGQG